MNESRGSGQEKQIVVIACRVFQTLMDDLLPENLADQVIFLEYGLHVFPKNLTKELQAVIDQLEKPSVVILGYGLCGNGLNGIQSRSHTLIIPKTDDCIAILLGSYDEYLDIFQSQPGTYYLTKGWLEAGSNPLQEYQGYVEKYGAEKADMVMDMQYSNYRRLMFVAHDSIDFLNYGSQVEKIAVFCQRWDMQYEERIGSDRLIRQLFNLATGICAQGNHQLDSEVLKEFVLVPPNTVVTQRMFVR
jgi:hypothetical protein